MAIATQSVVSHAERGKPTDSPADGGGIDKQLLRIAASYLRQQSSAKYKKTCQ
ncbi:MAG: hypothetical protein QXH80_00715 [Candidatus Nanoarchaeia archaeon]